MRAFRKSQFAAGRGLLNRDRLDEIHRCQSGMLNAEGVNITAWYDCPNRPDDGCSCRKPAVGLFERRRREYTNYYAESLIDAAQIIMRPTAGHPLVRRAGNMSMDTPETSSSIRISEAHNGMRMVSVSADTSANRKEWETAYSLELIEHILRVMGPAWLCDEIMRDEDPSASQSFIRWNVLSYSDREDFAGCRLLDFGSGCGASTMVLSRMFPQTQIVGVELVPEFVEVARRRAEFYGVTDRVRFALSPDSDSLPAGIGNDFDYVVLSGVYEHLLPEERQSVIPLVWSRLRPGGMLFLFETPHRWFPIESHTTVLPFINYLPDFMAHWSARHFSRPYRVNSDISWTGLLRLGIRGGTVREIVSILDGRGAELLTPSYDGVARDQIDLWYQHVVDSVDGRKSQTKRLAMLILKGIKAVTGYALSPYVGVAFRKYESP